MLKTTLATNWDIQVPISIIFPPIEFKANWKRLIMHKPVQPMMMGWVVTLTGSMSKWRMILTLCGEGEKQGKLLKRLCEWWEPVSSGSHMGKRRNGFSKQSGFQKGKEHERRKTCGKHLSAWYLPLVRFWWAQC